MNDIDFATTRTGTISYADDTVIYTKDDLKTKSDEHKKTGKICNWAQKDHLTLKADKTKLGFTKTKNPSPKHSKDWLTTRKYTMCQ